MNREPIIIIGAIIAVLQVVVGILTGHVDVTLITAALTAVGSVFGRAQVTPVVSRRTTTL